MAIVFSRGHAGAVVREVPADAFVARLSSYLETSQAITPPKWADLIKTASFHQMPPNFANWWYTRAASIARQLYLHPNASVGDLRNRYGGKQHNGSAPCHFAKAGGKIVRVILQELERIQWATVGEKGGRILTAKGQQQLDKIALEVSKAAAQ
jgi:small subunit ribosomal protein S19e